MQKTKRSGKGKARLQQPPSSFADYTEIPTDEDVGKDFGVLVNAPLSKGGHLVLKSEKAWSADSSQYSDFFTLNLKLLSAAIDCIPFDEYTGVDQRYFTSDQLTSICNTAEKGKAAYSAILDRLNASSVECSTSETSENAGADPSENSAANAKSQSASSTDNVEEDIDFLLSLKEPIQSNPTTITQPISISHNDSKQAKPKNVPTKSIDLEKWLDSVLDD